MKTNDITVILQGSTLGMFKGKRCVEISVNSIKKFFPDCKIIISTWKGEILPENVLACVDKVLYNEDPGFMTRDCTPKGKPNNVNRQILSTINGLNEVQTNYALKMRTDFVIKGNEFIKYFDQFNNLDDDYAIFSKRVICGMFGTRKPYAKYYNLPFHISDFFTFGLTEDLKKLYNIPLMSEEEFRWLEIHPDLAPGYWAKNIFGGEQYIWIKSLLQNNKDVKCKFCIDVSPEIAEQSEKYLANNFYPISFRKSGIYPLKKNLLATKKLHHYTDYYTEIEWQNLYKKHCDNDFIPKDFDNERFVIDFYDKIFSAKFIPKFIKSICKYILGNMF